MPTYPIVAGVTLDGKPLELVGAGFSHQLLGDLLRKRMGFQGVILSDWAITNDCTPGCRDPKQPQERGDIAMPWGVEDLSEGDRFVKGVMAGIDQFGGVERPDLILAAIKEGRLSEARIDQSVRRVLIAKFEQGLFENPVVDPAATAGVFDAPATQAAARDAQHRAQVVLKADRRHLPLKPGTRVYAIGIAPEAIRAAGFRIAASADAADVAIVRMSAPHEMLHPNHFFGSRHHEGRLDFRDGDTDYEALKAAAAKVPVIVSIFLDRPAILANVREHAAVLLANFGASDAALLDVIAGTARATGRLPFELPASMEAVATQDPAKPNDSAKPLYPAGFGLGY
jgi:beta-glucosidase